MKTVFLDANILFAATLSETGGSRMLFLLAEKGKIKLVTSLYALGEAKKNIQKKASQEMLPIFWNLCSVLSRVYDKKGPSKSYIKKFQSILSEKDIPILHAATKMKVTALITLDRKDFMNSTMKKQRFPFSILTPGELIQSLNSGVQAA